MYCIQEFIRPSTFEEPNNNKPILPEITNTRLPAARNCAVPVYKSCILERAKNHSANNNKVDPLTDKEGHFSHDKINVGDFSSDDQFVCKKYCRLCTGYRRESHDCFYQGVTIYNDAA